MRFSKGALALMVGAALIWFGTLDLKSSKAEAAVQPLHMDGAGKDGCYCPG